MQRSSEIKASGDVGKTSMHSLPSNEKLERILSYHTEGEQTSHVDWTRALAFQAALFRFAFVCIDNRNSVMSFFRHRASEERLKKPLRRRANEEGDLVYVRLPPDEGRRQRKRKKWPRVVRASSPPAFAEAVSYSEPYVPLSNGFLLALLVRSISFNTL